MKTSQVEKKTSKAPVKTSNRKRPNKKFIMDMVKFRGHMTGNEKTLLVGLEVKNALQRVNNRAMSDDVNVNFNAKDNTELQHVMKEFVKGINKVLKGK